VFQQLESIHFGVDLHRFRDLFHFHGVRRRGQRTFYTGFKVHLHPCQHFSFFFFPYCPNARQFKRVLQQVLFVLFFGKVCRVGRVAAYGGYPGILWGGERVVAVAVAVALPFFGLFILVLPL
jgi:hypothetical protein